MSNPGANPPWSSSPSDSSGAPVREDQVSQALRFLSDPRTRSATQQEKEAFLRRKGLSEAEIAAGDTEADPILAVWRYGLGMTAAFTSDLTERWGKDWVNWDQYQQLVNQMITRISRTRREQYLRVYTYVNGNEGVVVVASQSQEDGALRLVHLLVGMTMQNEGEAAIHFFFFDGLMKLPRSSPH